MSLDFATGDTGPSVKGVIFAEDDPTDIEDLSQASGVRFQMRKPDDRRFTVNAPAIIVNPQGGEVRYDWGPNDLSTAGDYNAQWEITYQGGRVQTTLPVTLVVRRK